MLVFYQENSLGFPLNFGALPESDFLSSEVP